MILRDSPIPIYYQIKLILLEELRHNPPEQGVPFLTEEELVRRFNVSRAPIRQALKELVDEGYIYRERAKGTFPAPIRNASHRLGGLVQHLREQGLDPKSRVSDVGWVRPPANVRAILGLDADAEIFAMTRLTLVDDEPIIWGRTYLDIPKEFKADPEEIEAVGTILELLERKLGLVYFRGEQQIWATAATEADADALGIEVGDPMLVTETTTLARDGHAVFWGRYIHRANRFKYVFPVTR